MMLYILAGRNKTWDQTATENTTFYKKKKETEFRLFNEKVFCRVVYLALSKYFENSTKKRRFLYVIARYFIVASNFNRYSLTYFDTLSKMALFCRIFKNISKTSN